MGSPFGLFRASIDELPGYKRPLSGGEIATGAATPVREQAPPVGAGVL